MENETVPTSPDDAAARLQGYVEVRARVEHRGPSRAISLLLLGEAVAMAVMMGAFLFSFGGRRLDDVYLGVAIQSVWLLVFPIVVLRSLVRGAQEGFSVRKKPSPAYWIAYTLLTVACLVLVVAEVTYPWWVNLLVPVLLFMAMAASPVRQLRRSGTSVPEGWTNEPLSRPVCWTTMLVGVWAGLLAVFGTQEWFPILSPAIMLLLFIDALFSRRLPRAGAEWGSIHWAAFGIVTSLLFVLFVLLSNTDWVTAAISIAAGALALLVMLLAAFRPFPPTAS